MIRRAVWAVLISAVLAGRASADDFHIWFRAGIWFSDIDGDTSLNAPGFSGTKLDIDELLGSPDTADTPGLGLTMVFGDTWRIHLDAWREEFKGTSTLAATATIDGKVFAASTLVSSLIDLAEYSLLLEYPMPFYSDSVMSVSTGFLLGVKAFDVRATIKSKSVPGIQASVQQLVPVPLAGTRFTISLPAGITVELTGLGFRWDDIKEIDIEAMVLSGRAEWRFWRGGYLAGGYRRYDLSFKKGGRDGFDVELDISGPFVEFGYRF